MGITWFGALIITGGLGQIDHQGFEDTWGSNIGKVEISQEIATTRNLSLQITGEHWSSIETDSDKGANAAFIEISYRHNW